MYGREKLEYYIVSDEDIYEEEVYLKNQADKVMDAMERRIARLTALVEGWKRNSVELGDMYHKRLEDVQNTMATENADLRIENHKLRECNEEREEQIKELEVVKEGHEEGITWLKERIKALESIPHTDNTAVIEALQKRIKELEATISKMETTTPKWISVKYRLPNEKEHVNKEQQKMFDDCKYELRATKYALWMARASKAEICKLNWEDLVKKNPFIVVEISGKEVIAREMFKRWQLVERKCREKAEEYR